MRLTQIKLAGFKSFVDPTTLNVPGQLVAVIGPNGCGKSNVIDAVRWVLGEASAKQLRGESMQDVIFNGANTRKASAKASVELVFDNSDGTLQGAWGQYQEVSIKRSLTRQGDSHYYINNQVVRRRDITDLFLGTGVGARGYAVIEQGMISKIIEAKPEELRSFLEEAAGVSKYKERRKETASRLKDSQEHLQRLDDIQTELNRQVDKLDKQAKAASHYQSLRNALHEKQDWLDYLYLQDARSNHATASEHLSTEQTRLDELQHANEAINEASYQLQLQEREQQQTIQAQNANISTLKQQQVRLEEQTQQKKWQQQRLEDDKQQLQTKILQLNESILQANNSTEELQMVIEEKAITAETLEMAMADLQDATPQLEDALFTLEQAFNHQQQEQSRLKREQALLEQNIQFTEQKTTANQNQLDDLLLEKSQLDMPDENTIEEKNLLAQTALMALETVDVQIQQLEEQQSQLHDAFQAQQNRNHALLQQKVSISTELKTLSAQLKNQQQQANHQHIAWLQDAPLLWQSIEVTAPWQEAVSLVLDQRLFSRFFPDLDNAQLGQDLPTIIDTTIAHAPMRNSLAEQVFIKEHDGFAHAVALWLSPFVCADNLQAALNLRDNLLPNQCIITPEGYLIDACSIQKLMPTQEVNVLVLQQQIDLLSSQLDQVLPELADTEEKILSLSSQRSDIGQALQTARANYKDQQNQAYKLQNEANALVLATKERHKRAHSIDAQVSDLQAAITDLNALLRQQQSHLKTLSDSTFALDDDFVALTERRESQQHTVKQHQLKLLEANRQIGLEQLELQKQQQQLQHLQHQKTMWLEQIQSHQEAQTELVLAAESLLDEDVALMALQTINEQLANEEEKSALLMNALQQMQSQLQACQEQQQQLTVKLPECQQSIQQSLLKQQEAQLAMERFQENLNSRHANFDLFKTETPPAKPSQLAVDIVELSKQIQRLGAVNLAALGELEEARERQSYYQNQYDDISNAISLLNEAIAKIDLETKTLFVATFDKVNEKMQSFFPTLFGGGEAKLHLVGDDVLEAGVSIMARPPGKKNSTIYLLSGGEKALTAMSLVFALFSLNPAPFCLLDEVDAPLDDANTSRFCRLVEQMSDKTQFLYISHNRLTMEMAEQLIGVTMQEKGVSRIVDVNIKEAINMAEAS